MDYVAIAKEIIDNKFYAGVRTLQLDEKYQVGDYCRESYEWDIEHDCSTYDLDNEEGEKAGGVCVTLINTDFYEWEIEELAEEMKKKVEDNKIYNGDQIIVVGHQTTHQDGHFDEGEGRIVDGVVLALVE